VAPSSSSTKRAARLAQKGQGRKIRFQGGTLFPLVVAIVLVVGFALVVYARQSRPEVDASSPSIDDHWHHAYGFYLCDTWFQLAGAAEETDAAGNLVNTNFQRTGIHSHDDGVIHWHAFTGAATGSRATLGLFLDVYDVSLSDTRLEFPESQRAGLPSQQETGVFENGETTCDIDGEQQDGELKVVVWQNFTDTDDGRTYIADFDNIRLDQDSMVVSIAFVPPGTDVSMPPWSPDLPTLGSVDDAGTNLTDFETPTTLPGETLPLSPGGSVPDDSVPVAPLSTETSGSEPAPAGSAPPTTGG
jgi:hypothetical protein